MCCCADMIQVLNTKTSWKNQSLLAFQYPLNLSVENGRGSVTWTPAEFAKESEPFQLAALLSEHQFALRGRRDQNRRRTQKTLMVLVKTAFYKKIDSFVEDANS